MQLSEGNNQIGRKYTNLSPLSKDTVSFSASAKVESEAFSFVANKPKCQELYDCAEPAIYYLNKVLDKYIGPLEEERTGKDKTPYLTYTSKRKTPTSIREKIASKFSKISGDNNKAFIKEVSAFVAENFPLKQGANKKNITAIVSRSVADKQKPYKIPPHPNAKIFLADIRDLLEASNIVDTSHMSKTQVDNIYENLEDRLIDNIPNQEHNDGNAYINPRTRNGVIHYANDICQSRIVMLKPDKDYTSKVLAALETAVRDGALKITSVENNLPDETKIPSGKAISDYEYVDESVLKRFAKSTKSKYCKNTSKSGYLGIHINVDLSNDFFDPECNGYTGEIQIIGQDVLELKHVEDLCYKIKDFQDVEKRGYGLFEKYFNTHYHEDENGQAFNDYTYSLYLAQRALPPARKARGAFASVEELGYAGKGLEALDYNKLRVLKEACDMERANLEEEASRENQAKGKSKSEREALVARNKSKVSYYFK